MHTIKAKRKDETYMKEETIQKLKKYHQEQILNYIPLLSEEENKDLEQQILSINFEQLETLYKKQTQTFPMPENTITNIPFTDKEKLSKEERNKLQELGEQIIRKGKHAVVTMAGGQGTRLRTFWSKRYLSISNYPRPKILIPNSNRNFTKGKPSLSSYHSMVHYDK